MPLVERDELLSLHNKYNLQKESHDPARHFPFFPLHSLFLSLLEQMNPYDEQMPDESGCKLLDSFAIFVQLVLATLAFSTLIIKRQRESPQRPLQTW